MMTPDQRSALQDPAAFGLRKLKSIQRMCGAGKSVNEIWLVVNFAVYDLKLGNARNAERAARRSSRIKRK